MNETSFVTVSQINEYIKTVLSADENLTGLFVRGEISNFTHHLKSGHFYFTLKDEKTSIKAVMFKGSARYVKFHPENGMKVVIFGSVRVFERDGIYQLYCEEMQPDGIGALYMAFEQLKQKLDGKGYFDPQRKRKLPSVPQRITLITAPTGAALHDILNIISRRFPLVEIKLLPVLVQGEKAPEAISRAFQWLSRQDANFTDLVILARGGGSMEDLAAFNTELVADAIYNCRFPVISAIGHETDFTIADFVADLRAPTPSAAAELAVPDCKILMDTLDKYQTLLYNYTLSTKTRLEQRLKTLENRIRLLSPQKLFEKRTETLKRLQISLSGEIKKIIDRRTTAYISAVDMLEALSPLKVLTRGYSITFLNGKPLNNAADTTPGTMIETKLEHGRIISEVLKIDEQS